MTRRQFLTVAAGSLAAFAPVPAVAATPPKPIGWAKWSAEDWWRPVYCWIPANLADGIPPIGILGDNGEHGVGVPYAVVACYAAAA